jgi:phosphopantetheine--protein transferase-like protein
MVGVGIDAVDVERFSALLERRPSLRSRLFTDSERSDCRDQDHRLAARFAAKEAVMKALGVGLGAFGFHDASVERDSGGQPRLQLRGRAAELAGERGVSEWHVSLTHTELIAQAVVIAE